ncbi:MAG: SH3 domain-containing protein, partial [Phycisphaerae bacterium]|nr:SH3 domain-containing protein [Phycisphaerae bacterium]
MQHGSSPAWMRAAGSMTLATAALFTLSPAQPAFAQDSASPAGAASSPQALGPFVAMVTGNAVNIRSGPSAQSAYVFGKLKAGDAVQVLAEEFGWARVRTIGPAFSSLYAYVPADRRVTLGANGSAQVTARTDLRAPNIDAGGSPDKSWKQIGQLEAGTTLAVLDTVQGEKDTVYKVALPNTGEGWVNMSFLRRATAQEAAAHAASLLPATAVPAPVEPASPALPTSPAPEAGIVATSVPVNAPAAGAAAGSTIAAHAQPQATDATAIASGSPSIPPLLGQSERAVPAGTRMDSHGEGSIEVASTPKAPSVRETRISTWGDLEAQWE